MVGDIRHIVIIESLDNERETGTELYNDCIKRNIEFRKSSITHNLHKIKTKEEFCEVLSYYKANSPYMADGILIHLEMHGDDKLSGLLLADNTLLTWADLVNLFRPINVNTCNSLYITMATCNGRFLYKGVNPHEKSPFSCYISSNTTVVPSEIVDQFTILFERLIENGNLVRAYLDMEKQGTKFYYKDSYETFEEAFQISSKSFVTEPKIKEEILNEAKMKIEKEGFQMLPDSSFDEIVKLALKKTYERHKKAFDFTDCK